MRALLLASLLLVLTACGSKINQENFAKINNGMTHADVVKLLGEPQNTEGGGLLGLSAGTSVWKDDKHQITVIFFNEKVTSKMFGDIQPAAAEPQH